MGVLSIRFLLLTIHGAAAFDQADYLFRLPVLRENGEHPGT